MWIKSIRLTNWRGYENAVFNIPSRDDNSQSRVVVIGAENGKGKTSLLEAITLCLFGELGLSTVVRVDKKELDSNRKFAYGQFLESAFCRFTDSLKAEVEIVFETDNGRKISVKRVWYFTGERKYQQDELFIQENDEDLSIPAMANSGENRKEYLADYITQQFMPSSLSQFFLFDGVQVQQMARHRMKDQVKKGIEGILGIPIVNTLANDLEEYAQQRIPGTTKGITDAKLQELQRKIDETAAESAKLAKELQDTDKRLEQAKKNNDDLLSKYQKMGGDSMAKYGELQAERGKLKESLVKLSNQLAEVVVKGFAMSLVGQDMLTETAERLRKESARVDWERNKDSGEAKYDTFAGNLEQQGVLSPPLTKEQEVQLHKKIKSAWYDVWHPMPDDCAKFHLNPGFSGDERNVAMGRLKDLSTFSDANKVKSIRERIIQTEKDIFAVDRQITSIDGSRTDEAQQLHQKLKESRDEIERLGKEKGNCERKKTGVDYDLSHMRQELTREAARTVENAAYIHKSNRARIAADMIRDIIRKSYSGHVYDIAQEMTIAYRYMAHKKNISRIEISDECDIELLTKNRKNFRELDPSHGESEIFSLALIAAIVHVSKNRFPLIIDTPLANLDNQHRSKFLHYFSTEVDNQIFFLSTNEEIRKEQMDILQSRIACKFLIEQEQKDEYGRNVVREGTYFKEVGT